MRINHQKIIQESLDNHKGWTCEKDVSFKNKILNFHKDGEIKFSIEKIPAGKYLKTLYFIILSDMSVEEKLFIKDLCYRYEKERKGLPVDWALDFSTNIWVKWFLF